MSQGRSDKELLIQEYIREKTRLEGMSEIHAEFTGQDRSFSTWDGVVDVYEDMDLSGVAFQDLLEITKEYLEKNVSKKSESYFDILRPSSEVRQAVIESLESNPPNSTDSASDTEGFSYRIRDDGVIESTYHYSRISVDITDSLDLARQPQSETIQFRAHPEDALMIAKTTYSPHVQKLKSAINDLTGLTIDVSGDLTYRHTEADERISRFINEFKPEGEGVSHEFE